MTEQQARSLVRSRSGGRCELCRAPATDYAHRVGRGQGGGWSPSNACDLCHRCHMWATAEPRLAAAAGWRVEHGDDPADVAVWLATPFLAGWHLLDDAGGYEPLWNRDDTPTLPPWCEVRV